MNYQPFMEGMCRVTVVFERDRVTLRPVDPDDPVAQRMLREAVLALVEHLSQPDPSEL